MVSFKKIRSQKSGDLGGRGLEASQSINGLFLKNNLDL